MDDLSLILWRERELLDTLLFKLEQERLMLASGRTRWLGECAQEIESVLERIRQTEVLRAVAADSAAEQAGLASNPSLRVLAASVDEPWRTILTDHRDAFVSLTNEISDLANTNRDLITVGYRAAREALLSLGDADSADSYSHDGTAVVEGARHRLVDRSL